jgi:carbonic anhydrase
MGAIETLTERNADFAAHAFRAGMSMLPTLRAMIVGCVDPRVDPAHVLGLEPGEAAVIRNVGGRITPATLQAIALLGLIPRGDGENPGEAMQLVVLHHTDCGITRLAEHPDRLAEHFGIPTDRLGAKAVSDPRASVVVDLAVLKDAAFLPDGLVVSGLVYDVATGLIDCIVPPAPLRDDWRTA